MLTSCLWFPDSSVAAAADSKALKDEKGELSVGSIQRRASSIMEMSLAYCLSLKKEIEAYDITTACLCPPTNNF
jgi:hypothetical protein